MAEAKPPHYDINPLRVIFVIPNRAAPTLSRPELWSEPFRDFISKVPTSFLCFLCIEGKREVGKRDN